jgi:hypothetical protein
MSIIAAAQQSIRMHVSGALSPCPWCAGGTCLVRCSIRIAELGDVPGDFGDFRRVVFVYSFDLTKVFVFLASHGKGVA